MTGERPGGRRRMMTCGCRIQKRRKVPTGANVQQSLQLFHACKTRIEKGPVILAGRSSFTAGRPFSGSWWRQGKDAPPSQGDGKEEDAGRVSTDSCVWKRRQMSDNGGGLQLQGEIQTREMADTLAETYWLFTEEPVIWSLTQGSCHLPHCSERSAEMWSHQAPAETCR